MLHRYASLKQCIQKVEAWFCQVVGEMYTDVARAVSAKTFFSAYFILMLYGYASAMSNVFKMLKHGSVISGC